MSIKDHPRLCGEKFKIAFVIFARSGSPPPMRGKETKKHIEFHVNRITPAYAGKSAGYQLQGCLQKDHPRLCGEKTKKIPKQRYFFHQPASFSFSLQYT